jgi:hypothetical protein
MSFHAGLIMTLCGLVITNVALFIMRMELNNTRTWDERIPMFSGGIGGWSRILVEYRESGRNTALPFVCKTGMAITFLGFTCAALSTTPTHPK